MSGYIAVLIHSYDTWSGRILDFAKFFINVYLLSIAEHLRVYILVYEYYRNAFDKIARNEFVSLIHKGLSPWGVT